MFGGERAQVFRAAVFVEDNTARAQVVDTVVFDDVRRFKVRAEHSHATQPTKDLNSTGESFS